jgi:RNA polymerase sigma-70 factor (ECF subfamily)
MAVSQDNMVRIMLRERPKVLAFIRAIVRDRHLAEDVYQDISISALEHRNEIRDEQHLQRWLRHVARNRAINAYRQQQASPLVFNDTLVQTLELEWSDYDELPTSQTLAALDKCIERLSPYARRLVELRYTEGLSGKKLADVVNRKTTTVYVAIARIHRALGNCIRHHLKTGDAADE